MFAKRRATITAMMTRTKSSGRNALPKNTSINKTKRTNKDKEKKQKKSTAVTFSDNNHITIVPPSEQDNLNTIASRQTRKFKSKEEEEKQIPPKYVRYRLGFQLDQIDVT